MAQKLVIENLHLSTFKDGQYHALVHGINLEVQQGRVLALVGGSGSGKSLTCGGLQGVFPPGVMCTQGGGWITQGAHKRAVRSGHDVATIMQNPRSAFNPVMTIRKHAIETARYASRPYKLSETELQQRLSDVDLADPHISDLYPFEMSGGMLQRAMLALALISNTPFIVADEPTTDLDLVVQSKILDMLMRVAKERHIGILFVTHDMGVVARIATDVAVMHRGRIIETNTVERIFCKPQHTATRTLVQAHLSLYPHKEIA